MLSAISVGMVDFGKDSREIRLDGVRNERVQSSVMFLSQRIRISRFDCRCFFYGGR